MTGGTTATGEVEAVAVSSGVDFPDGTTEASHTLSEALIAKKTLLDAGYDVLMIRETDDVQLDNIARTLIANHYADCHIAIHYDYTETDKGAFFMSVPSNESYREMEPVKSHWQEHNALGRAVVSGLSSKGFKLCDGGEMEMDLTQTSYSTVPSIDLEVGDKASDTSEKTQTLVAEGIKLGLDRFFVEWEEQKKSVCEKKLKKIVPIFTIKNLRGRVLYVILYKTVEKEEYRFLLPHREPLTVRQWQVMLREWAFEVSGNTKSGRA